MLLDRFRKNYKQLRKEHSDLILEIKTKAEELEQLLLLFECREMSLAMINLEQVTMWATKAFVLHDEMVDIWKKEKCDNCTRR